MEDKTYAFVGEPAVGRYVNRAMEAGGWTRVEEVSDAGVVLSYCSHMGAIEDAYFDSAGLIKSATQATLLVDLSPSSPSLAREIAAIAAVSDLRAVEAPLAPADPFAGAQAVSPEDVICFAAGEQDDVEDVRGLLGCLARDVRITGKSGTAQLAKAAHTVQLAAQVVGAVEASALVRSLAQPKGPEDGREDLIGQGMARKVAEAASSEDYEGCYTVGMLMSDVAAAMASADDVELILPQLEAALHLLELMAVIGGADMGLSALSLLYREEEASAAQGLDWSRAEGLYGEQGHEGHGELGLAGGFGGYSEN